MIKNIGPDGDSAYFSAIVDELHWLASSPIPALTITGIHLELHLQCIESGHLTRFKLRYS